MRTKLLFILVMLGIMTIGCSRKAVPAIPIPTEQNPCDNEIKALVDKIKKAEDEKAAAFAKTDSNKNKGIKDTVCIVDSSDCNYYKLAALEIAGKYNTAVKERDFYKALSQSQAKKIVNNTYINSKNKNSQIGDGNVQQDSKTGTNQSGAGNVNQEVKKGPAQNGNDNEAVIKPKKSATGAGASVDNVKKIGWFWIFVAGYLFCHVLHKIIIPAAMRVIPFANLVKTVGGLFLKLKFW